jgi:hypothetical protein
VNCSSSGIEIGETSVGKYLVRPRTPPSQSWRTFLDNHLKSLWRSVERTSVPQSSRVGRIRPQMGFALRTISRCKAAWLRNTDKADASNADNTAMGESWRRVRNPHLISQIGICESHNYQRPAKTAE